MMDHPTLLAMFMGYLLLNINITKSTMTCNARNVCISCLMIVPPTIWGGWAESENKTEHLILISIWI